MIDMKDYDINLYSSMIALHNEMKPTDDHRTILDDEEIVMLLKRIMEFLSQLQNDTFTMHDMYSEMTDIPISEVINNWNDYIYTKKASDIRKIIYFLEECEIIKKEDVYTADRKQSHYYYTPSRFNSRLDLLGL